VSLIFSPVFLSEPMPPPGSNSPNLLNFMLLSFIVILAYQFFTTFMLKKKLEETFKSQAGESPLEADPPVPVNFSPEKALKLMEEKHEKFLDLWEPACPSLGLIVSTDPELQLILAANLIKAGKTQKRFTIIASPAWGAEKLGRNLLALENDTPENDPQKAPKKLKAYEKQLFLAVDYPLTLMDIYQKIAKIKGNFEQGTLILDFKALDTQNPEQWPTLLRDLKRLAHRMEISILLLSNTEKTSPWIDFSLEISAPAPDSLLISGSLGEKLLKLNPQTGEVYGK